jgi:hypothetical protein
MFWRIELYENWKLQIKFSSETFWSHFSIFVDFSINVSVWADRGRRITIIQRDEGKMGAWFFSQLFISPTYNFINLQFHQLTISSTDNFINLQFHQLKFIYTSLFININWYILVFSSMCKFIFLHSPKLVISSTCQLINFCLYKFAISSTWN